MRCKTLVNRNIVQGVKTVAQNGRRLNTNQQQNE